jgi:CheY-like chemotaxis protein
MLLQASNHDVRTARDGASAMKIALDYRPDVVFLDIGLPEMDGYAVAQRIRREPALQGAVLVAMTGYGHEAHRQRSRDAGFDHHLVKPADFDDVERILAAVPERPKTT